MSFGYGVGDFLALLALVNDVRRRFIYAPPQFKATLENMKSLSNVLRDIEDIEPEDVLSKLQKQQLHEISRGCYKVLEDLHEVLNRYQEIGSTGSSLEGKSRRVWKRLKWDPREIQKVEQRVHEQVCIFNLFLSRLNLQVNIAMHTLARDEIDGLKQYLMDDQYEKILDWLSPINYAAQQSDFLNRKQEDSGQWLLGASQFLGWVKRKEETLFCPGVPGAGKTILVSMIINYLEQQFSRSNSIGIAYIYCSFEQRDKQRFRDLLASLVRQLAQDQSVIPTRIKELYTQNRNRKIKPGVTDLLEFLRTISAKLSRVFIVVDALDECESSTRGELLAEIHSLQQSYGINFLATSRYIPDIMAVFEGHPSLEIRANHESLVEYLSYPVSFRSCADTESLHAKSESQ